MAVGKGSMARAAAKVATKDAPKAVVKKSAPKSEEVKTEVKKAAAPVKEAPVKKAAPAKKPAATKKAEPKKAAPVKKAPVKKSVIAGTDKQVMDVIVYEANKQMLDRDAKPNERFEIGDDMPVYFF